MLTIRPIRNLKQKYLMAKARLQCKSIILGVIFGAHLGVVALANPENPVVTHGQVTFSQPDAQTLNVTNSPGAVINWGQFSIQLQETTRFIQQSATSAVLNRVVGQDPSTILGQLLSNGKVFLINPNGVIFGEGSVVDTAGLIASTLDLTDEDFIAGNMKFQGSNAADISNQGYIKAGVDGNIFLIAPNIENSGIIETDGGQIVLAAGESITIASLDSDHIVFEVQAPEHQAVNLGQMITNGGAASMFAGTIKHSGSINADSLTVDENGIVRLFAKADIEITSDAVITANGSSGGEVEIESETGTVWNSGVIEAKGSEGKGGRVEVLGERVALLDKASIDVSGKTGGGEILVGGDYQGKNPDIKNAKNVFVGQDTSLKANAVLNGDGGKVIVWADEVAKFYGGISAKGGAESGDGGFVETSGKDYLEAFGRVDASAANGKAGQWLLDPTDISLEDVDTSSDGTFDDGDGETDPDIFTPDADRDTAVASIDRIVESLEAGTNVRINTVSDPDDTPDGIRGTITVFDEIDVELNNGDVTLTLDAAYDINIDSEILAGGDNRLTLELIAYTGEEAMEGEINISADIDIGDGLIDATGGSGIVNFSGNRLIYSDLNAKTINIGSGDEDQLSLNGGGTVSFIANAETEILNLIGGDLDIFGDMMVTDSMTFDNASLGGNGTLTTASTVITVLASDSGSAELESSVTWQNDGIVDFEPFEGLFNLDGTFINNGTFNSNSIFFGATEISGDGSFINTGTFNSQVCPG